MSDYLRAVAYMAAYPQERPMLRLTGAEVYDAWAKAIIYMREFRMPADLDPVAENFRLAIADLATGWALHHAATIKSAEVMMTRHMSQTLRLAVRANERLAAARSAPDAMTALELRSQARSLVRQGFAHRGMAQILRREIVTHPQPRRVPFDVAPRRSGSAAA